MRLVILLLLSMGLLACSSPDNVSQQNTAPVTKVDLTETELVKQQLMQQYQFWKGTPYQYGGHSKKGIDCSGFVNAVFSQGLGRTIPRSTLEQAELGYTVSKHALKAGDLLFFQTGNKVQHVGIYIDETLFLHASTSKGVIISSLNNVYWSPRFWIAKRLY